MLSWILVKGGTVIYCGLRRGESEAIAVELGSRGWGLVVCDPGLLIRRQITAMPCVVLVDMGMDVPRMADRCLAFRAQPHGRGVPMILLFDHDDSQDILLGFGVGADDCLVRPIHPAVAAAHVQAVMRRYQRGTPPLRISCLGPLRLDHGSLDVSLKGKTVRLTPTEFALLEMLASRRGSILRRGEAVDYLRLSRPEVLAHSLETHFSNLRRKLGPAGRGLIETVSGVGYRLKL